MRARGKLFKAAWLATAYALTGLVAAFAVVRLTARGSMVTVPAVIGLDLPQVRETLGRRGLEMAIAGEGWSETQPAGCVVAQVPAPNTKIKRGRRVKLTLSRGSKILDMPDLAGRTLEEARFALRQIGLQVSGLSSAPSRPPPGTVLAQEPVAGKRISRDFPIRLLVSEGAAAASFAVPAIAGMATREALAKLRSAGLRITDVSKVTSTFFEAGTVISQDPPAGFRALPGDEIRLTTAMDRSAAASARYVFLETPCPPGRAHRIRIIIIDEKGRREIANEVVKGGEVLRIPTRVAGDAVAQIFIDGTLVKEDRI